MPANGGPARTLTSARERFRDVSWTADGRIITGAGRLGGEIAVRNIDGSDGRVIGRGELLNFDGVTSCGTHIVFDALVPGTNDGALFRMDATGGNVKQITTGPFDHLPVCSPDGKWIYFRGQISGDNVLKRISIDGTDERTLLTGSGGRPSLSPDGKWLAFTRNEGGSNLSNYRQLIVVMPAEGGPFTHSFARGLKMYGPLSFTGDGKHLVLGMRDGGADNLWMCDLDGKNIKQITSFTEDRIPNFRVSPDGKTIGLIRVRLSSDAVLITDTSR
jgi:Tol biopolymer transport system component